MKVSIVITAYNEPQSIKKAIEAILPQLKKDMEVIVSSPDKATTEAAKQYKQVKHITDPGKGKSYALNLIFKKLTGDMWIFTDGDVYIDKNAIEEILKPCEDKRVACVTGRPVPINKKNTMTGYWAHLLYDAGAHKIRKRLNKETAIPNNIEKFVMIPSYARERHRIIETRLKRL